MKKLKLLLPLLVALQCTLIVTAAGMTFMDVISTVQDIAESIQVTADSIQLPDDVHITIDDDRLGNLLEPIKAVFLQMDVAEALYSQQTGIALKSLTKCIDKDSDLLEEIMSIWEKMVRIFSRYRDSTNPEVLQIPFEISALTDYAKWAAGSSFSNNLRELHRALDSDIFVKLAHEYERCNSVCKSMQTTQQFLYSVYWLISLVKLKAHAMMEFANVIRRLTEETNLTWETQQLRWDYASRTENVNHALVKAMEGTNRVVYRCDPVKHVPNVTYAELTRLLQGYIANEVDLSAKGSCGQTCDSYKSARSEGCYDSDSEFCAQQPKCSGRVYDCQFVDSDMTVCQAPSGSNRRYDYIKYENGRLLGQNKECERGTTNKVESWRRWIFWRCSYCFCLCDEQGPQSDRYFNLRKSFADVEKNKVVTGLRFIKKNRVIHLQIQQGTLLPHGGINETTLEWKALDEYHIDDKHIVEGVDYHTMDYSSRSIDLDNIMSTSDNSFVITGVRFRVLGPHLNLMARISKFDFKSGKLFKPKVNSVLLSNVGKNRQKLNLEHQDVFKKTMPLSQHNQYLDFVNSGMNRDAAQATVPFIDIQDVVSYPPAPLSGIGLYYKAKPGNSGFLAPKIITYDFSTNVQVPKSDA